MWAVKVDEVLRDLGPGHHWAPGEEPAFFEKVLASLYLAELPPNEIAWGVIFLLFLFLAYRMMRMIWLTFRPRRRSDLDEEMEQEWVDERKRRYLQLSHDWSKRDKVPRYSGFSSGT